MKSAVCHETTVSRCSHVLMPRRTLMQLRDNWRGIASETRAQPFARISTRFSTRQSDVSSLSGNRVDFTVVISVVEERVVVHRKRECEMKGRDALDPERSRPWKLRTSGRWSLW